MLIGRTAEQTRLDKLLTGAREARGGALVLVGEAGIGKSELCRHALRGADGMTVLVARGLEAEAERPFGTLADLLQPVTDHIAALPPPQAVALQAACALAPPAPPTPPFAVGVATLALLADIAEHQPLLVVVDDLHWVDGPSRDALLFVARRLEAERIAMLLSVRADDEYDASIDLATLALAGLDAGDSGELLVATSGHSVSEPVAAKLHAETGGNPLALEELAGLLNERELTGLAPLAQPLPPGPVIERAFRRRLDALDDDARTALLVTAASASRDSALVVRALGEVGLDAAALEAAETAGHVRIAAGRVEFRHPLLRSTAYHESTPADRRQAHAALAQALRDEPTRAAWHLAECTLGYDEDVALRLAEAGLDARLRCAHETAGRAVERAAQLTPDATARAMRLAEAAGDFILAGRPDHAARLTDDALEIVHDDGLRADITLLHGTLQLLTARPAEAYRSLVEAAGRIEDADPTRAAFLLATAVLASYMDRDVGPASAVAERAYRAGSRAGGMAETLAGAIYGQEQVLRGDTGAGTALLEQALPAFLEADPLWGFHPQTVQSVATALVWLERFDDARHLLDRGARAARRAGAPGSLPYPLAVLADADFRTGAWDRAYSGAHEALVLARETGQVNHVPLVLTTLARIEAARGLDLDARAHLDEARNLARDLGVLGSIEVYADAVLGFLELGLGRSGHAIAPLRAVERVLDETATIEPAVVPSAPDLVEALAREGRADEARAVLAVHAERAERSGRSWAHATAQRGAGILADPGDVDRCFSAAMRAHECLPMPFELARTQLCYGERLRRERRPTDGRRELRRALDTFESLGAAPWAERAAAELRATGETARSRTAPPTAELTPQELRVALTVAEGSTNKEAAAALFLSPKTVEYHLGAVYRKLGLRSRAELARMFADQDVRTAR